MTSDSHAPSGRMIPLETRYEVSTQVASSLLADRLPAICGSATLAMLESSASMKVAMVTVNAIGHGLIAYVGLVAGADWPPTEAVLTSTTRWVQRTCQER